MALLTIGESVSMQSGSMWAISVCSQLCCEFKTSLQNQVHFRMTLEMYGTTFNTGTADGKKTMEDGWKSEGF